MRRTPRYEIRLAAPFADNLMNSVAHCRELPINVERPLRHIYELGAWLVTQGCHRPDKFRLCPFFCLSVGTGDRSKLLCTLFPPKPPGLNWLLLMVTPRISNMAGICAQVPTPGLSCSLEWLCFRSSLVWCKSPKNNEFRTKKFPNQEFLYGISSFCTLTENNCFLHGKISCFCIFLAKNGVFNTNRTPRVVYGNPTLRAMHSIHKCVAKGAPHLFHWRLSSVSVGRTV